MRTYTIIQGDNTLDMDYVKVFITTVAGYLLGSVSIAVLLSKYIYKKDVRLVGSKNAGATNIARIYGMSSGLITLTGDVLKTVIAMMIGKLLLGIPGLALSGVACLIGHCWPVFFKFRGGKGVAVGAAIAALLDWRFFLIVLFAFIIMFIVTKTVSAGSLAAAVTYPVAWVLLKGVSLSTIIFGVSVMVIVVIRHSENLRRLVRREEKKFSFYKKPEEEIPNSGKENLQR